VGAHKPKSLGVQKVGGGLEPNSLIEVNVCGSGSSKKVWLNVHRDQYNTRLSKQQSDNVASLIVQCSPQQSCC